MVGVLIEGHAGKPGSHSQTRPTVGCVFRNEVALRGWMFRQESPWTRTVMIHERVFSKRGCLEGGCLVMGEGANVYQEM